VTYNQTRRMHSLKRIYAYTEHYVNYNRTKLVYEGRLTVIKENDREFRSKEDEKSILQYLIWILPSYSKMYPPPTHNAGRQET